MYKDDCRYRNSLHGRCWKERRGIGKIWRACEHVGRSGGGEVHAKSECTALACAHACPLSRILFPFLVPATQATTETKRPPGGSSRVVTTF